MKKISVIVASCVALFASLGAAAQSYELENIEAKEGFKDNLVTLVNSYDFTKPDDMSSAQFYKAKQNLGLCMADKLGGEARDNGLGMEYVFETLDRIWEFNHYAKDDLEALKNSVRLQKACQDYHPDKEGMVGQIVGLDIRQDPECMVNQVTMMDCFKERSQEYMEEYGIKPE